MDKEIERLQKGINGKVVKWSSPSEWEGLVLDAILLWPPDGQKVTLKPYGYKPRELSNLLGEFFDLERVSHHSFCLSSLNVEDDTVKYIKRIADIPENGEYIAEKLYAEWGGTGDNPSCPYG
jgi:hypothetical protein